MANKITEEGGKSFTTLELAQIGSLYREIATLRETRNKITESHNSLIEIIEQDINRCLVLVLRLYESIDKIGTKLKGDKNG